MTEQEFWTSLEELRALPWRFTPEGAIRLDLEGQRFCPITAVVFRETEGTRVFDVCGWQSAGVEVLGLTSDFAFNIATATDTPTSEGDRSHDIRQKLIAKLWLRRPS